MMQRLLVGCWAVLLTGCVATGTRVDEHMLFELRRGQTTYHDVVAKLGKPNFSTLHANGSRQIAYVYTQQQLKVHNFIPVVALFSQGATSETSTVTLDFDAREVLVNYTSTQGQAAIGTGVSSGARQ